MMKHIQCPGQRAKGAREIVERTEKNGEQYYSKWCEKEMDTLILETLT